VAAAVMITLIRAALQPGFKRIGERYRVRSNTKFSESAWKFAAYSFVFVWGVSFVVNKRYFHDMDGNWDEYPYETMDWNEHAFYIVQMGYYIHMIVTVFTDVRRSDFLEYIVHHAVTLFLIVCSYAVGHFRIGILILVCHDINDILLEVAKTFRYLYMDKSSTVVFAFFAVVWVFARLLYFPFVLVWSVTFRAAVVIAEKAQCKLDYTSFNILLYGLVVLHIYWFALIVKIIRKSLKDDGGPTDIRENEDSDDDDDDATAAAAAAAGGGAAKSNSRKRVDNSRLKGSQSKAKAN